MNGNLARAANTNKMAVFTAEMRDLVKELIRTITGFEVGGCMHSMNVMVPCNSY